MCIALQQRGSVPFFAWFKSRCATALCNFTFLLSHGCAPAALASLVFDPPDPQIIGKKIFCNLSALPVSFFSGFFPLSLSLVLLYIPFFSLTLLCVAFVRVTVGSLNSNFFLLRVCRCTIWTKPCVAVSPASKKNTNID